MGDRNVILFIVGLAIAAILTVMATYYVVNWIVPSNLYNGPKGTGKMPQGALRQRGPTRPIEPYLLASRFAGLHPAMNESGLARAAPKTA